VIATLVGAFGPVLFKKASGEIKFNLSAIKNKNLLGGVFLYGVATLIFIPALKGGDLSILYPLVGLTYIWVSLLSVKVLGEKMNYKKWIGVTIIIIGVSLLGIGS